MSTLELHRVVKHYESGGEVVRAADGVSLTIEPGEIVALYGPSGSGKTTLLLLAAGLLSPDAGEIRFGGQRVADLSRDAGAQYRRGLGFVFQSFHLMPAVPAIDNATLKLLAEGISPARARKQATTWLARLGLADRAHHPPERLSMGERQRVAIARALANDPRLILADEPTGNLDSVRSRQTLGMLARLCRERSVGMLLVTHDRDAAHFADRVYDLRDGCLAQREDHVGVSLISLPPGDEAEPA
ncbi:MAG TPA: ABC transporter ATP-binding protein [Conexibacter sp.]|jgi:putative ABC transport system ATP-binding protein|nr:ABC transporter ATP-binding protein [Conexibacter sp.]